MIYDEVWIDLNKFESGYAIAARRNEEIAQIKIKLTNKGELIDNSKFSVKFVGNNAKGDLTDGEAARINGESGAYLYTFSKENLSVSGQFKRAYFEVYDSSGKKITSSDVKFRVIDEADMSADQATIHVTILEKMVEEHENYINQGKENWEGFVDQNKEIIESVDPGGTLLSRIGMFDDFRKWDKEVITKMANEFTERGANPKWYGAKFDGVTDDTEAINVCLSENKNVLFPRGTTVISAPLLVKLDNANIVFNDTQIKANVDMEYMIKIGNNAAPGFTSNCKLSGKCTIDGNNKANHGIYVVYSRACQLRHFAVSGCKISQITISKKIAGGQATATGKIENCVVTQGSAEQSNNLTGITIDADDCALQNVIIRGVNIALKTSGAATYLRNVHGWTIGDFSMANGAFIEANGGSILGNYIYCDTYPVAFRIKSTTNISVIDFRSYYNQEYYSLTKIMDKELPIPTIIEYGDIALTNSPVRFVNSVLAGCIDGGGHLTNYNEFIPDLDLVNCRFDNMNYEQLELNRKKDYYDNWQVGEIKEVARKNLTIPENQIGSIVIKPLVVSSEPINGSFSGKGGWYAKNSNAQLSASGGVLTVTGSSNGLRFAGCYTDVTKKTWLYLRGDLKCDSDVKLKFVDRNSGKSIVEKEWRIQPNGNFKFFSALLEIPQPENKYDIEFQFYLADTSKTDSIQLRAVTCLDVDKNHMRYMFETISDLNTRLDQVGFIDGTKTLDIDINQEFVVYSFPSSLESKLVVNEEDSGSQRSCSRSIDGLVVTGTSGTNTYKYMLSEYNLNLYKNQLKRGSVTLNSSITPKNVKSAVVWPQSQLFSNDIRIDGSFKKVDYWYKQTNVSIPVARTDKKLQVQRFLSHGDTTSGNSFLLEYQYLTNFSDSFPFKTQKIKPGGYYRLPIFKGGNIEILTSGGGFADVEILYSE